MNKQTYVIDRPGKPMPVPDKVLIIDEIHIVSSGDADTEVIDTVDMLINQVQGNRLMYPLMASFKTPETLKGFIEELIAYRNTVWQDAAPVNPAAQLAPVGAPREKFTLHERFSRLQAKLYTDDEFRVVRRAVAERFCRRFTARIVSREHDFMNLPTEMLILYFDHPDIGKGSQLIAFVKAKETHANTQERPSDTRDDPAMG